jgi:hypothetical protein
MLAAGQYAVGQQLTDISLSADDRSALKRVVEEHPRFKRAAEATTDRRIYLTSIWAYSMVLEGNLTRRAEVEHFKYEGGVTIRTHVDMLPSLSVINVESLPAYPTPLAADELSEAVKLAREGIVRVKALYESAPEPTVRSIVVLIADRDSPRFGHRIVVLSFTKRNGRDETVSVEVDLTARTVTTKVPAP